MGSRYYTGTFDVGCVPEHNRQPSTRRVTLVFEDVHPAVYETLCPSLSVLPSSVPVLQSYVEIDEDQAAGIMCVYREMGRDGDVITVKSLYATLKELRDEGAAGKNQIQFDYAQGRMEALQLYIGTLSMRLGGPVS